MARKSPALAPYRAVSTNLNQIVMLFGVTYMLGHSVANRNALGTSSYWVGCIFDIGARDDSTASQKQSATNVEV